MRTEGVPFVRNIRPLTILHADVSVAKAGPVTVSMRAAKRAERILEALAFGFVR